MSLVRYHQRSFSALLPLLLAVAASLWPLQGQVLYGTLVGTVEDSSHAMVPRAAVRLASPETGLTRETSTDTGGRFQFTNVLPGTYTLNVSQTGFRSYSQTGVGVTINTVSRVEVRMDVGAVSDSVTVAASSAALQTDKADVHTEISAREVTDLPLAGYRNYQSLINLVPGASPARTQNATIASPGRALATNVNGTPQNNNNNRLDGTNNVRATLPHQAHHIPPVESIETVNVSTNNFDADQGFAGGAAVNVMTKSGTNEFHGVVFENNRNSVLMAKDFFYREAKRPKNILNMFGGVMGGPIRKDKLFFFASWERLMERENQSLLNTVATASQRAGDFSTPSTGYGVIFDPSTGNPNGTARTPFADNRVPMARQSAITRKMQALVPAPNQPDVANNYFASKPMTFDRDTLDAKVNWNVSQNTTVWGKYSVMRGNVTSLPMLDKAGGPGLPWGAGTGHTLAQLATLAGTHTFSPTMTADMNLGFTRYAGETLGFDYGTNFGLDELGIPGTNGKDPRQSGMPIFAIGGYTTLGQVDTWMPKILYDNSITYNANLAWTKGGHDIRFGEDLARELQNHWHPETGQGPRGGFTFDSNITALRGGAVARQYNGYAAFLLGLPSATGKAVQLYEPYSTTREWRQALFFRDRWQASRNLTVSLGLRWEYYPVMMRKNSGIERYDVDTDKVLLGGIGGNPNNAGTITSNRNFAPRFGLAYRLGQKSVVRAGYGISIDPSLSSFFMLTPYPAVISSNFIDLNAPYVPFRPIENGFPEIPVPNLSSGIVNIPGTVSTGSLDKGPLRRGYVQSFNFVVQRELPWKLIGSVGYVGTRTVRQLIAVNINAALQPGAGNAGLPLFSRFGRIAATTIYKNAAGSSYDSLQATADRRFVGGILAKVAYTWGKAIGLSDNSAGGLTWNMPSQYARNRAVAGYDRTQNFRFASVFELPFGKGKLWANQNLAARMLLGGWQINGIFSAYTGTPFTVTASGASLNAPGSTQTADQVKATVQKLGGVGPGQPFYDPSAFVPVREVRFGTSGRNILRGPGVINLDLGLFRQFNVGERRSIQFRAESLNFTNTPHFANPNSTADSATFMIISSTSGQDSNLEGQARQIRFTLRISF